MSDQCANDGLDSRTNREKLERAFDELLASDMWRGAFLEIVVIWVETARHGSPLGRHLLRERVMLREFGESITAAEVLMVFAEDLRLLPEFIKRVDRDFSGLGSYGELAAYLDQKTRITRQILAELLANWQPSPESLPH